MVAIALRSEKGILDVSLSFIFGFSVSAYWASSEAGRTAWFKYKEKCNASWELARSEAADEFHLFCDFGSPRWNRWFRRWVPPSWRRRFAFPLLLYVPPLLGIESLDVKSAAALVVSQVFFASLIGRTAHWRSGRVHGKLTLVAAVAAMASSFLGGVASKWVSEWFLLLLFGAVTLIAAAIMLLPVSSRYRDEVPLEERW